MVADIKVRLDISLFFQVLPRDHLSSHSAQSEGQSTGVGWLWRLLLLGPSVISGRPRQQDSSGSCHVSTCEPLSDCL